VSSPGCSADVVCATQCHLRRDDDISLTTVDVCSTTHVASPCAVAHRFIIIVITVINTSNAIIVVVMKSTQVTRDV